MRAMPSSNLLHRYCWSTLPVASRKASAALPGFAPSTRRLTSARTLATHTAASSSCPAIHRASTSRSSTGSTGVSYAALWLSVLAAGVWLNNQSTVSADAPPRAINSKSALARQVNRAAAMGDVNSLRRLLKDNPSPDTANLPHPSGWTPLHAAAANGPLPPDPDVPCLHSQ